MCLLSLLFGRPKKNDRDDRDWIMECEEMEICMYEEEEED